MGAPSRRSKSPPIRRPSTSAPRTAASFAAGTAGRPGRRTSPAPRSPVSSSPAWPPARSSRRRTDGASGDYSSRASLLSGATLEPFLPAAEILPLLADFRRGGDDFDWRFGVRVIGHGGSGILFFFVGGHGRC